MTKVGQPRAPGSTSLASTEGRSQPQPRHAHAATFARRLGDAALLSMFTLTAAPRAPSAFQRRVASRRAQRGRSRAAGGGARAVLKNGGFRNGDAARRGDDERAGDEPPLYSSRGRSFHGSSVATDGARAETPGRALRSDEKSAPRFGAVPEEPASRVDPDADEVSFFPKDAADAEDDEDDVPLPSRARPRARPRVARPPFRTPARTPPRTRRARRSRLPTRTRPNGKAGRAGPRWRRRRRSLTKPRRCGAARSRRWWRRRGA